MRQDIARVLQEFNFRVSEKDNDKNISLMIADRIIMIVTISYCMSNIIQNHNNRSKYSQRDVHDNNRSKMI